MTQLMAITKNELVVACQKAYAGIYSGFDLLGEPDRIAKIVLNNQLLGFNGIDDFAEALRDMLFENGPERKQVSPIYHIDDYNNDCYIVVDLQHSAIVDLPVWLDKALEYLRIETSEVTLQLNHASQARLVIGGLMELKRHQDVFIQATWTDPNSNQLIVCVFNPGSVFPSIYNFKQLKHDSLTVVFKQAEISLPSNYMMIHSSHEIESHYHHTFKSMITVADETLSLINDCAKRILVKSTLQSKKGAGE